jgi:hypothetical protein
MKWGFQMIRMINRDTCSLSPGRGNKIEPVLKEAKFLRVKGASGRTMEFEVTGSNEHQIFVRLKGRWEEAQRLPLKGQIDIQVIEWRMEG